MALARRERFPDVNVNLGVMPRGDLDPMWLAGVSVPLPIWSHRKQGPAVHESEAMTDVAALSAATLEQTLRLRVAERHAVQMHPAPQPLSVETRGLVEVSLEVR